MTRIIFPADAKLLTMNDQIRYQCTESDRPHPTDVVLECWLRGGAMILLPIRRDIEIEDLLFLCDRLAFVLWGIHGQYGVYGVDIPEVAP